MQAFVSEPERLVPKPRGSFNLQKARAEATTFRIGTIGHVYPSDMGSLIAAIEASISW